MTTTPGIPESIICPVCGRRSYNPNDVRDGYCVACHDWTSKPERPLTVRDTGGCRCNGEGYDFHVGRFNPDCTYHNAAFAQPWNHQIPWNCPTYRDGCNCEAL
jgi:hypothetical protein